ncbi:MAG: MraY family glycosyltransferase [Phycisphaerae bacterium]|nr:MraY family glycosyltransferase [Phycisphaerae bacterium]
MSEFSAILQAYLPLGAVAFGVALVATPGAMALARRLDIMDHPDTFLKPHARPTPYLGGLAIAVGWAAALVGAIAMKHLPLMTGLYLINGGLAIALIGMVDDARHLAPKVRLLACVVIALAVMLSVQVGQQSISNLGAPLGLILPEKGFAGIASLLFGLFVILGACNSTNLIDGLDGLCAGVSAIVAFGYYLLAADLAVYDAELGGHKLRLVLAIAVCGASLGFLFWNFNPARIFMGDAGSLLLGFCMGLLIMSFADAPGVRWLLAAIVVFTVPIFDTALAIFRRWRSGKPLFVGDRSHFYDQLVQRGCSVRVTAIICYLLAGVSVAAAIYLARMRGQQQPLVAFAAWWILVSLLATSLGFTRPEKK